VGGHWLINVVNNRLGKKDIHHFVACVETNGQFVASFAAAAERMQMAT